MWQDVARDYKTLIQNTEMDSIFLREQGLIPNILDLLGNYHDKVLLDAGAGTGWLFEKIKPVAGYACDLVRPENHPIGVDFEQQDVTALNYVSEKFDIVVASLLLMFCEKLDVVCAELFRVAKRGGSLIIALTHPYFYRSGYVTTENQFCITENLANPSQHQIKIAEKVGPLTYYYRPLPDYINTLINSGWQIVELRDWFIDMEKYNQSLDKGMRSKIRRSGNTPLYTFIKCQKISPEYGGD